MFVFQNLAKKSNIYIYQKDENHDKEVRRENKHYFQANTKQSGYPTKKTYFIIIYFQKRQVYKFNFKKKQKIKYQIVILNMTLIILKINIQF